MKIEKLSFYALIALVFATPFVFINANTLIPEFVKVAFIVICALVSALSLVYVFWQKREVSMPKHPIVFSLVAIIIVSVVSAIFSGSFATSFFGQGIELLSTSLFLVMSLVLYLVAIITQHNVERPYTIYKALVIAFGITFLYHVVRLFVGPDFLSFGIFDQITSAFIGKWHEISTFAGLILVLFVSALEYLSLKSLSRWLLIGGSILTIGLMVVTGFPALWFIVGLVSLAIVSAKFATVRKLAPYSLVLLILAGVFVFTQKSVLTPIQNHFGVIETEIALPWQTTVDITAGIIKAAPLLGSGPNKFVTAYNAFKPAYINNSSVWLIDFANSFGIVPTLAVTTGLIGIIAWIVFFWFILQTSFRVLKKKIGDSPTDYILVSSLLGTVFVWLMALVYTPSYFVWLITFVITGILISSLKPASLISKSKTAVSAVVAVFAIVFILWGVVYARSTIAQMYYQSGVVAASTATDITGVRAAEVSFAKAVKWHDIDTYERSIATAYVFDFQNALTTATDTTSASPLLTTAVSASDRAIALNSTNYTNYLAKAKVVGILAVAKVDKAQETAMDLYQSAASLSPNNPSIFYQAGLLEVDLKDTNLAQKFFSSAIQMKPDYTDAIAMLGSVFYDAKSYDNALAAFNRVIEINPDYQNIHYFKGLALVSLGKNSEAIAELELAAKANPNEPIISKYLEQLKTQGTLPTKTTELPLTTSSASSTSATAATSTKLTATSTKSTKK